MTDRREAVVAATRRYILDNFLYTKPDARLEEHDRLLERGIVDSMGVMELVSFLQERFAIRVDEAEIVEANFGSIGAIATYVAIKQGGAETA
jgi:acyl carrier protein